MKSVFSRVGAGMCLMVVIWYALATVLSGMLYQALHTTNLPNWAVYVASDAPLYLVAMPLAVLIMGKSSVIETRKFDMKPGQFFKLLVMCFPHVCGQFHRQYAGVAAFRRQSQQFGK